MKHTRLMERLKGSGLKLHKSRLEFLSLMMVALVQAKTVNLAEVVGMIESRAQEASLYRRAQRFLGALKVPEAFVVRYTLGLQPKQRYCLCLDRTNWKFGKLKVNILMLAYAHEGTAVPLLWCLLPKFGNSATSERIGLMNRLLELMPKEQLEALLADREFVGKDWFA